MDAYLTKPIAMDKLRRHARALAADRGRSARARRASGPMRRLPSIPRSARAPGSAMTAPRSAVALQQVRAHRASRRSLRSAARRARAIWRRARRPPTSSTVPRSAVGALGVGHGRRGRIEQAGQGRRPHGCSNAMGPLGRAESAARSPNRPASGGLSPSAARTCSRRRARCGWPSGCAGIDLDLAADARDAQVDRAVERLHLAMAVTSSSQSRLSGRLGFSANTFSRSNSLAASVSSLPSARSISTRLLEIEHAAAHAHARARARRRRRVGAAQHALHARQQLARLEGLGDVVVGAGLQPDHAVDRVGRPPSP